MASPIRRLVQLVLDRRAAAQMEADARQSLGGVETALGKLKSVAVAAGAAIAAALGLRALLRFGEASVQEAEKSEAAWSKLAGTVRNAGGDFGALEGQLRTMGDAFRDATVYGDEEFAGVLDRLVALTGDVQASLHNIGLVANVAARFFDGDLAPATDLVAKAMNGILTPLQRMGLHATTAQGALDLLAQRSMGAAEARAQTFGGQLKHLNELWLDFKEGVGFALVGNNQANSALGVLSTTLREAVTWVGANRDALREWVTAGLDVARTAVTALYRSGQELWTLLIGPVLQGVAAAGGALGKLGVDLGTVAQAAGVLAAALIGAAGSRAIANLTAYIGKLGLLRSEQIAALAATAANDAASLASARAQLAMAELRLRANVALGASEATLAIGADQVAIAQARVATTATFAAASQAALTQATTLAGRAMAATATMAKGLWTALGGWVGLAIAAVVTAYIAWRNHANAAADATEDGLRRSKAATDEFAAALKVLNAEQLKSLETALRTERNTIQRNAGPQGAYMAGERERVDQLNQQLQQIRAQRNLVALEAPTNRPQVTRGAVDTTEAEAQKKRIAGAWMAAEQQAESEQWVRDQSAQFRKNEVDGAWAAATQRAESEQWFRDEVARQGQQSIDNAWTEAEQRADSLAWYNDEVEKLRQQDLAAQAATAALAGEIVGAAMTGQLKPFALGKARENVIEAAELGVRALTALLNPFTASKAGAYAAAAVKHLAIAGAWKAFASSPLSGGSGGGGGAAGSGASSGSGTSLASAQSASAPAAATAAPKNEVHIYLEGPGFDALNPVVQRVVWGAQQAARERYGTTDVVLVRR